MRGREGREGLLRDRGLRRASLLKHVRKMAQ